MNMSFEIKWCFFSMKPKDLKKKLTVTGEVTLTTKICSYLPLIFLLLADSVISFLPHEQFSSDYLILCFYYMGQKNKKKKTDYKINP